MQRLQPEEESLPSWGNDDGVSNDYYDDDGNVVDDVEDPGSLVSKPRQV